MESWWGGSAKTILAFFFFKFIQDGGSKKGR